MARAWWLVLLLSCTPASPGPGTANAPIDPGKPAPSGTSPTPVATRNVPDGKPWTAPPDPRATAMAAELQEIGLDPKALPPLDKLDATTLRAVMKTFTRSLGVQCSECHEKDFRKPTPKKKIATHMWNDFARTLTTRSGDAVYCDGCHQQKATFLDRSDPKQLGSWMNHAYVEGMTASGCSTCHGEPFEAHIFAKRWK